MIGSTSGLNDSYQQVVLDLVSAQIGRDSLLSLHVNGGSMAPLLRPGDIVTVQPVRPEVLRSGDLILVRRPAELVTHRLLDVDAQGWHTKGDSCRRADEPVLAKDILGRVVTVERGAVHLDLQSRRWALANQWLSVLGRLEAAVSRRVGAHQPTSYMSRAAWASAPFRVLIRLTIWLLLKV